MDNVIEPGAQVVTRPDFHAFASVLADHYKEISTKENIFKVALKKGELFDVFLNALPEADRQWHTCNTCRGFLNRYGGAVTIDADGTIKSALWNLSEAEFEQWVVSPNSYFLPALDAMRKAVESGRVVSRMLATEPVLGFEEKGGFNHFFIKVGRVYSDEDQVKTANQAMAESAEDYRLLSQFVGKVGTDLLKKTRAVFLNDADLNKLSEFTSMLEWAVEFKETHEEIRRDHAKVSALVWNAVATKRKGILRIGQGVMSKFLKTYGDGDLAGAKRNFLAQVDQTKRMIKTAAPTQGNIDQTKAAFAKLNLEPSLARRPATEADINFKIWEPTKPEAKQEEGASVFDKLAPKDDKAAPELPVLNGGVVSMQVFLKEILPTAKKLHVNLNRNVHYGFVGLCAAVNPDAPPLLYWDLPEKRNIISGWQYKGGVPPHAFGLAGGLVEVTAIVPDSGSWNITQAEYDAAPTDQCWILAGAHDANQRTIPLAGHQVRRDLHQFLATLQRYFDTTPITPLPEGQKPIAGLGMPVTQPGLQIAVNVQVTKEDAVVMYHIDRSF